MVTGVVTQIDNQSGAWVDTHGVKAFLHISKIREEYLEDVAEVLSVGDEVTARVVKVEPATGDVALSMRPVEEVKVDMQVTTPSSSSSKQACSVPKHTQDALTLGVLNMLQ
jgi:ribosomal protein S1